jgi:hypothetical protein
MSSCALAGGEAKVTFSRALVFSVRHL